MNLTGAMTMRTPEINLAGEDALMRRLMGDLHLESGDDVARVAIGLLMWAVDEQKSARVVVSANKADGSNIAKLCLPGLTDTVTPSDRNRQ